MIRPGIMYMVRGNGRREGVCTIVYSCIQTYTLRVIHVKILCQPIVGSYNCMACIGTVSIHMIMAYYNMTNPNNWKKPGGCLWLTNSRTEEICGVAITNPTHLIKPIILIFPTFFSISLIFFFLFKN